MKPKPRNASQKRNHLAIRYAVRQPILVALVEKHYAGGVLSLLNDLQLAELADVVSTAVMRNEQIQITVKRSK